MTSEPPLRLAARDTAAHKGTFGRVLLVGGSRGMSGSIALSSIAALRCGAGLVTAAVPDRCVETVAGFHPCVMTMALSDDHQGRFSVDAAAELSDVIGKVSAVGCGPGMTTQPGSVRIVERLLGLRDVPSVLDADAINVMSSLDWCDRTGSCAPLVITPHPGELARLTEVPASDRAGQVEAASRLARRSGAVIVVKGGPTVVVGPEDQRWTNTTGNPGMATAGSGDVLTGVITSLLAQGFSAWQSACLGVWVHGLAGDLAADDYGQAGMTAVEINAALPVAIRSATDTP
ncbi:MAG: NAD(P)H-hydrate dehydratase [Rubripirellula sp.]